jgi:hypothetical protein
MHVVRLLAPRLDNESHLKDIDFSPSRIRERWRAGYPRLAAPRHAAAAPPRRVTKSRRFMGTPSGPGPNFTISLHEPCISLRVGVVRIRVEKLLAVNLILGDRVLALWRHQPIDELVAERPFTFGCFAGFTKLN